MQPMPGQPVAQQPVAQQPVAQQPAQVQALPAQGHMPVNINTGKSEEEWGIYTPTPAEWVTFALVIVGLLFWMLSYWTIDAEDPSMAMAMFWQGSAYMCWFGAVGSAVHSVEKALLNSKK